MDKRHLRRDNNDWEKEQKMENACEKNTIALGTSSSPNAFNKFPKLAKYLIPKEFHAVMNCLSQTFTDIAHPESTVSISAFQLRSHCQQCAPEGRSVIK